MSPPIRFLSVHLLILGTLGLALDAPARQSQSAKWAKDETALRKCVDGFWSAWQRKDYQKASQYVITEQQSRFMRLRKFPVRKWEIVEIVFLEKRRQAEVTVKTERLEPIMGDYFAWRHKATWIRKGSLWFMVVPEDRLGKP